MTCALIAAVFLLPGASAVADDDADLPLIRWSFWAPVEEIPALEQAFDDQIAPLLARHGFVDPQPDERLVPDDVLNRVYAVPSRQIYETQRDSVLADPAWTALMGHLGEALGHTNDEGQLPFMAGLYRDPVGPGTKRAVPEPSLVLDVETDGRGHWTTFGVPEGLPGLDIQYLFEDRDGNIWVCTFGSGVARWDGEKFTTYTPETGLAGLSPRHVMQSADGSVWISTVDGGLSRFDGERMHSFADVPGAPTDAWCALEDARGHIWALTSAGTIRWDGRGFRRFAPGLSYEHRFPPQPGMLEDRSGRLWIPSDDGIQRWDGRGEPRFEPVGGPRGKARLLQDGRGDVFVLGHKQVVRYLNGGTQAAGQELPFTPLPPETQWREWYHSMALDHDGDVWITNSAHGPFRWDGASWTAMAPQGTMSSWEGVVPHPDGSLWFSGDGITRYKGGFSRRLTTADGLDHDEVRHLMVDRRGALWAGTIGNLSRFDPLHFVGFLRGSSYDVRLDPEGRLWTDTEDGIALIHEGQIRVLSWESGAPQGIYSATTPDGALWFTGWRRQVDRLEGDTLTTFTDDDGLAPTFTAAIGDPRDGSLWLGAGPLTHFDGTYLHHYSEPDGLAPGGINGLQFDGNGRLWLNQSWQGLTVLESGRFTRYPFDDLPSDHIRAHFIDRDGVHWLGLDRFGAARWDGETLTRFTTRDGLAHNAVRGIGQSADGHLWFGTDGGVVSRFDGRVFQTLSTEDGLNGQSVRDIFQDPAGDIWFSTWEGVIRYRQPSPSPPRVSVDAVITGSRIDRPSRVTTTSRAELIAIEYSARSLTTPPGNHVYLYRLAGHESEWQQTRERRLEYKQLLPGEYVFEIIAIDRDLVYSDTVSVPISVIYEPTLQSLELDSLRVDDVFASFHAGYADRPVAFVRVRNNDPDTLRASVSFQINDWMRRATRRQITLPPGGSLHLDFAATLDPAVVKLAASTPASAHVDLSFAVGADTVSRRRNASLTIHPAGALLWDGVAPLAAFVTPDQQNVRRFGRETLQRFDNDRTSLGKPGSAVLTATILHEALRAHGLKYQPDASQPYVARQAGAVDHVLHPARTLVERSGDCDDLTALYASLLESAGIATALVDFPEHVFLLIDTGLSRWEGYRLPVPSRWTVDYGDRLWIPLEVTRVDRPFREAWEAGAEEIAQLPGLQLRQRITTTASAWERYTPVSIEDPGVIDVPSDLGAPIASQVSWIRQQIDAHLQSTYIGPLRDDPSDDGLRTRLMRIYVSLGEYDAAIDRGLDDLLDGHGDAALTNNHLGIAYYLKGQARQAANYFRLAAASRPDDEDIQRNLQQALWALGRAEATEADLAQLDQDSPLRGASGAVDGDSFHWIQ